MLDKSLSNTKVTHTYIISNSQIYNTILAYIMEQVAEKLKVKILLEGIINYFRLWLVDTTAQITETWYIKSEGNYLKIKSNSVKSLSLLRSMLHAQTKPRAIDSQSKVEMKVKL